MTMQIKSIILYNRRGQTRQIDFKIGEVNIITGTKDTGKSAIIHIVEYCMGNPELEIRDNVIRKYVSWYAVLFQINQTQVFVAKPTPDENKTRQSRAYIEQGENITIPRFSQLRDKSNDNEVRKVLSRLIRENSLDALAVERQAQETLRTSIEYTVFYLFQRVNEIANPEQLFHRQQESGTPQTIRETLPYFLGVVREDDLVARRELDRAITDLRTARANLRDAELFRDERVRREKVLLQQALEVNLLPSDTTQIDLLALNEQASTSLLNQTQNWQPDLGVPAADDRAPSLRESLNTLDKQYHDIEREIAATEAFIREAEGFSQEAQEQIRRLDSINVFGIPDDFLSNTCPLCFSVLNEPVPSVSLIRSSIEKLNSDLTYVQREEPTLRNYIQALRVNKENILRQMSDIRREIRAISEEQSERRDTYQRVLLTNHRTSTVRGMIKYHLENMTDTGDIPELTLRVTEAEIRVNQLRQSLGEDEKEDTKESILHTLGEQMTDWARLLGMGYTGFYRLDLNRLTVTVLQGKTAIPMRLMAGSKNSLGCHLIALLALHKHFIEQSRPTPGFLILDQPAQGYFPSKEAYEASNDTETSVSDMVEVQKMFDFLFGVCSNLNSNLQIIVLEHAYLDDPKFQSAIIEKRWTADNALIPRDWISIDPDAEQVSMVL